jgi:hypothetical protein
LCFVQVILPWRKFSVFCAFSCAASLKNKSIYLFKHLPLGSSPSLKHNFGMQKLRCGCKSFTGLLRSNISNSNSVIYFSLFPTFLRCDNGLHPLVNRQKKVHQVSLICTDLKWTHRMSCISIKVTGPGFRQNLDLSNSIINRMAKSELLWCC